MKNWLITGISRGLGKALAECVLARGDTVVGTVRAGEPEIEKGSGTLHVLQLDIAETDAIAPAIAATFKRVGRLDVLVNNAGYGLLGAIEEATDEEVERLFRTNVFGPMAIIREALPYLRRQGTGHVINITSIAARAPMASSGMYAAAKAAVEAMSQSLSQEVASLGLKVTAVAPGAFRTDFLTDHSVRRSSAAEAYSDSVGKVLAKLEASAGHQIGDPRLAAQAILKIADSPSPPLHLLLGSDALRRVREKLDAVIDEMDHWEDMTRSTDYQEVK
jgi:NAD(P)-dependent dehydrogenase (short-subunit alcohol dehydrogenase family)